MPATTSAFVDLTFEHSSVPAEQLSDDRAIVDNSRTTRPLVVQTRLDDERTGRSAVLEYPVKTMNYHPERGRFQVDTGPIIFPILGELSEHPIDCCHLAYTVFNTLDFAEYVMRPSTGVFAAEANGVGFRHYSELRSHPASHSFWAIY